MSLDLPTPASPRTRTSWLSPAAAMLSRIWSSASSWLLPTNGERAGGAGKGTFLSSTVRSVSAARAPAASLVR